MVDGLWFALTLVAIVGCGVMAGVFFSFSTIVMPALARLPNSQGIAAMQSTIVVAAITPVFLLVLAGTAAVCLVLAVAAVAQLGETNAPLVLAGALSYLAGALILTMRYHVPRNTALSNLDPESPDAPDKWSRFQTEWTTWNHVRTGASLAATILFLAAAV